MVSPCFWINLLIASESLPIIVASPVFEIDGGFVVFVDDWLEISVGNVTRDGRVVNSSKNSN